MRLSRFVALISAFWLLAHPAPCRAQEEEPAAPLAFANQAQETRLNVAYTRSRRSDALDVSTGGVEASLLFGTFPQLRRWRIGGASGVILRAIDDKTFLASLPYAEVVGGVRASIFDVHTFVGLSWLTLGASHARFALGGLAPRAGVSVGVTTRELSIGAFAATEYQPFVTGTGDIRSFLFGVSAALIGRPAAPREVGAEPSPR